MNPTKPCAGHSSNWIVLLLLSGPLAAALAAAGLLTWTLRFSWPGLFWFVMDIRNWFVTSWLPSRTPARMRFKHRETAFARNAFRN
jgi:hypothetical protein